MSTEWDDIQRKFGNLPPKQVAVEEQNLEDFIVQRADKILSTKNNPKKQGNEVEDLDEELSRSDEEDNYDDFEDDDFFEAYRKKRLDEMKAASLITFGSFREISESQFVDEVTNEKRAAVVVMLYDTTVVNCEILGAALSTLARKFPNVKFVKIIGRHAIKNYPNELLPTLLIYENGKIKQKIVGIANFGGVRLRSEDVEWELAQIGILKTDLEENPRATTEGRISLNIHRKSAATTQAA
eukprot:TRINITY_DN800_c4_g1_i1.p1 TRINITY_DN800_c4_g1~~TRINITY_DN800_c4_g1_i1.p1  ORF type:complete len:240 (-),score=136.80 TRINITY_DN800_c4_g1_i1:740-1459(-)